MSYSTFQLSKALEMPRPSIQRWLEQNRISPQKRAGGKGDRTIFTKEEARALLLFQFFRDTGFPTDYSTRLARRIMAEHDLSEEALRNAPYLIVGRRRDGRKFRYGVEQRLPQIPSDLPEILKPNGFFVAVNLREFFEDAEKKLDSIG